MKKKICSKCKQELYCSAEFTDIDGENFRVYHCRSCNEEVREEFVPIEKKRKKKNEKEETKNNNNR